ncbi:unnamed protein product [Hymenolepis diminuta]|uniref:Uncharacterized protein n=1 Tax=Hymenolepis diminuta TaxID=6216 RepID=A0A564YZI9_HYMDI|nr:unnamed protein product [Hymenolepis diminuta]
MMNAVLNDTAMVQQNVGEHGYVRRIAQLFNKRRGREIFQTSNPHHYAVYVSKCTTAEMVLQEPTFVVSVERKDINKQNVGTKRTVI